VVQITTHLPARFNLHKGWRFLAAHLHNMDAPVGEPAARLGVDHGGDLTARLDAALD